MFRNYLIVTLRSLFKNRVFTLINVLGLGMALSISIVAYFNYVFSSDFDGQHINRDEIYRVNSLRDMEGRLQEYGIVPATLGREIKKDITGIDNLNRILRSRSPVKTDREIFNKNIAYVDPEFMDVFTIPLISGTKQAIVDKNKVLISEELSGILFGNQYPSGQSISIFNDDNKEFVYMIAGVFENLPFNSSFRMDVITHFDNFLQMWDINDTDWKSWANCLFIQVKDSSKLGGIKKSLIRYNEIQNLAREDFQIKDYNLVPLKDVGDNTRNIWANGLFPGLHPAQKIAPSIMAILILLIACFNFTNTAIASAGKRLKEIGIRKVVGGHKNQLFVQFFTQNLIVCFLAMLVAIPLAKVLVPAYSSLWEYMSIQLTFTEHLSFWAFMVILLMFSGFMAGTYPALYISSFKPVAILNRTTKIGSAGKMSLILLTFQFFISVMAVFMGIVLTRNAKYQDTLDLGYDRNNLIVVPIITSQYDIFKQEIVKNPKITSIAGTQEHIGFGSYRRTVKDENIQLEINVMDIGPIYAETMGLRLLEGRSFSFKREEADRQGSIIVNKKLVENFGWTQPIGKQIYMNDTLQLTVIGVVKDFYINGVWSPIDPTLIRLVKTKFYYNMVVRTEPENLPAVQTFLKETWNELLPNYPYVGRFQEDTMEEAKTINRSIKQVNIFLAIVATFLSLIGLYTLVSLNIISRTKEIGIRKVMGASIHRIIVLLNKPFMLIIAIALFFGLIGGYYLSEMFLDSIWDHFLDFTADLFIWPVLLMFFVGIVTISSKVYHAAIKNPADSLRNE
ncbi:MAG: ABC transporter permease [Bacteroidetes bacterium]|nr:ABC transporter permease [Bacteroidota bacterium]